MMFLLAPWVDERVIVAVNTPLGTVRFKVARLGVYASLAPDREGELRRGVPEVHARDDRKIQPLLIPHYLQNRFIVGREPLVEAGREVILRRFDLRHQRRDGSRVVLDPLESTPVDDLAVFDMHDFITVSPLQKIPSPIHFPRIGHNIPHVFYIADLGYMTTFEVTH